MPRRYRGRPLFFWPYCPHCRPWGLPPWWMRRPSREEEIEEIKEHIKFLKEELKLAQEHLKGLERSK